MVYIDSGRHPDASSQDCDLEDVGSGWLWEDTSPYGDSVSSSSAQWWVVKVRAGPLSWVHSREWTP